MIKISPSILASDFANLQSELARIEKGGADYAHIDVMDGVFVPNITLGPCIVKAMRPTSKLVFDVHLMITKPQLYVEKFAKYAERISIHYESDCDVRETLRMIKAAGAIPSITIKPATPAEAIFDLLDEVGMVLVMSVEPGFGGQSYIDSATDKIAAIRAECDRRGLDIDIQVDGGINLKTAPIAAKAGANILVAGSAVFNADDMAQAVLELKSVCGD